METGTDLPDSAPCPYCGAANSVENEFCAACYKNLHIPPEVRAEAKALKMMAGLPAKPIPAAGFAPAARPAARLWARMAVITGLFLFYLQWLRKDNFFSPLDFVNLGWQLCLFWLGESLLNVSVYAGDAVRQALPLVGGGEHDWTYLLTETGLIAHTAGVAKFIFLCGSAVIFYSFYLISLDARAREPLELGNEKIFRL